MLIPILTIVIMTIALILGIKIIKYIFSAHDKLITIFIGSLFLIIFLVLGGIVSQGISSLIIISCPNQTTVKSFNIVSLRSNENIEGSFFIGSGTIGNVSYYIYYRDLGNDSYKMDKIRTSRTIIKETNEETPKLAWKETTNKVPKWICKSDFDFKKQENFKLIVPKGTIIKQFKLE